MSELTIKLDTIDPIDFLGYNEGKLKIIKKIFNKLNIVARGNKIIAIGNQDDLVEFEQKIKLLVEYLERYGKITEEHIVDILNEENPYETVFPQFKDNVLVHGNNGLLIKARTTNQQNMVDLSSENDILFAIGPAGTGKTYTGVALAVKALKEKQVKRIILTRPAVEAGENLGFLPGDMKEKLDPYLMPLYDALRDMIPGEKLSDMLEFGIIEIAPLAFMRGRTLDKAFVILDEVQNTTVMQMKMFLTRMGQTAQFVITGDMSQVDLPNRHRSGLAYALDILDGVQGLEIVRLGQSDVIRHPLVKKIVDAFDKAEAREKAEKQQESENSELKQVPLKTRKK